MCFGLHLLKVVAAGVVVALLVDHTIFFLPQDMFLLYDKICHNIALADYHTLQIVIYLKLGYQNCLFLLDKTHPF